MGEEQESPEGKKEAPQEKKEKKKAKSKPRPLGTLEQKSEAPEGNGDPQGNRSENKEVSEAEKGKSNNSSQVLEETVESPPEEKEAKMPLDEEGKKYVDDALASVNKKLGVVDKVAQDTEANKATLDTVNQALTAIRAERASAKPETDTKETPPTVQQVASEAAEMVRKEQDKQRKILLDDEARKKEREDARKFYDWCMKHPDAKGSACLTDHISEQVKKEYQAEREKEKAEKGKAKPLKKKEDMTPVEYNEYLDELERIGKEKGYDHPEFLAVVERCPNCIPKQKYAKQASAEEFIEWTEEEKRNNLAEIICVGDTCKPQREWLAKEKGIVVGKKEDLDNEIQKRIEEDRKARSKF